jgi:hypothetical protein
MIKTFLKKITGIQAIENARGKSERAAAYAKELEEQAIKSAADAKDAERIAKATPKERANERKEPWVAVLDTKVNPDNVRNGFFELDWNEYFIVQLKEAGYGYDGDPEEEIVDRWFRDLAGNMLAEAGEDPRRHTAGFINVVPLTENKSEVS